MDTAKLKNFAQNARRQLLEQVRTRLEIILNTDSVELRERAQNIIQFNNLSKVPGHQILLNAKNIRTTGR